MENREKRELILETMESMLEIQLRSVRRLKKTEKEQKTPTERSAPKGKSLVELCADILTYEQQPLHVDTLVELLKTRYGRRTDRDSLASALAKKARRGVQFQRLDRGTYALRNNPEQ